MTPEEILQLAQAFMESRILHAAAELDLFTILSRNPMSAKEAAGKITGDKKLEAQGKMDKAKGAARDFIGDTKDAARRAEKGDVKH